MFTQVEKPKENKCKSIANSVSQKKSNGWQCFGLLDNRPESVVQRKIQTLANAYSSQPIQKKENNTPLPDNLKTGMEKLSGYFMDDTNAHYFSDIPAQLQAHAYAQGSDTHLVTGQEKHLPNEAWHMVQQKEGRIPPTAQLKGMVNIKEDQEIDKEADIKGTKALQMKPDEKTITISPQISGQNTDIVQRTTILIDYKDNDDMFKAALSNQASPNPIIAFKEDGSPDESFDVIQEITKYAGKGQDRSKLLLIGHGYAGKMGNLNLPALMDTLNTSGLFHQGITDVNLAACYAMMKEDIEDSSVAYKLAQWLKDHITVSDKFQQAVTMVAGYTSNTSGEAVRGGKSYEWLDTRSILNGQFISKYIYYKVLKRVQDTDGFTKAERDKNKTKQEQWSEIIENTLHNAEIETSIIIEELIKIAPFKPWAKEGERRKGDEFHIDQTGIENEAKLRSAYPIASVTTKNYQDFPTRFTAYESMQGIREQVSNFFDAAIDKIYALVKPASANAAFSGVFSFGGGSGGGFTFSGGSNTGGGFTFGTGSGGSRGGSSTSSEFKVGTGSVGSGVGFTLGASS